MPSLLDPLFTYAMTLDIYELLMGLIISLVLGFSAGNYACSLVHRLPRGLGILDKKPYCGSCQTPLATKDLFPVFSALLLGHKCRYCQAPIPKTHYYTELAHGLLFCLCFTKFGFSEHYVLVVLIGSMLAVLASIHHNDKQINRYVLVSVLVTGLIYRTLVDASIFPALQAGLFATIVAALLWKKEVKMVGHIYVLPPYALLFIAGAIVAGLQGLLVYVAAYLGLWAIRQIACKSCTYTVPFSLALVAALMFSHISLLS